LTRNRELYVVLSEGVATETQRIEAIPRSSNSAERCVAKSHERPILGIHHVRRLGLPAIYESRVLVKNGGLISYGPNLNEMFRRVAYYVDRIIKGAKPSELPIERPTQFELVVNTNTAKQLGLDVPPKLLIRADEVIE
jgi:hypothetical protein